MASWESVLLDSVFPDSDCGLGIYGLDIFGIGISGFGISGFGILWLNLLPSSKDVLGGVSEGNADKWRKKQLFPRLDVEKKVFTFSQELR